MRRILDGGGDRWSAQIILLAFVCASVNDTDAYRLGEVLPGLNTTSIIAMVALGLFLGASMWIVLWLFLSWIAMLIGRLMGGAGSARDIRAALAWGVAPVIWSALYRIPVIVYERRFPVGPRIDVRQVLLDFAAHGGCTMIVVYLALQSFILLWCLVVATGTMAEAQRFSIEKAFANVAITLAVPMLVIGAAVFSFRGR